MQRIWTLYIVISGFPGLQDMSLVVLWKQGSLQPGGSGGTPDDYWLTPNKNIKHVL